MATGPAYMNATTSHPKVKATITLSAPLFVAGQDITGKIELDCKVEREVGIGLIMAELLATQDLNSRDHTATTTFVHSHRVFQGHGLPPSNAVYDRTNPHDPSFPPNYFPGRKGITTFFFRFKTPVSSPSSVSFASGVARIEYKIRVNVGIAYKDDTRLLSSSVDVGLVQCEDMEGTVEEHVVVGESGKVYIRGKLINGQAIVGEKGCLELHVKNQTSKKTTGLTLALTRSLHLCRAGNTIPIQLTDTLITESFRSAEYCVPPGIEGVANLVFDVPGYTRVVKGGYREDNPDGSGTRKHIDPLFELRCYLSVKIGMGLGSKDILFEMPIQVKHRAVLGKDVQDRNLYLPPVSPEPVFNRAIPPLPSHSPRALSPLPFHSPHTMSPVLHQYPNHTPGPSPVPNVAYYNQQPPRNPTIHPPALNPGDRRALSPRLWSPTSPIHAVPYTSQSPLPTYYYPPPPAQLLPFAYPARPNSADPHYYTYYHNQTNLRSGLPPVSNASPFFSPSLLYQLSFQYQSQSSVPPVFSPPQPPTLNQPPIQPQVTQPIDIRTEAQQAVVPVSQPDVQPEEGKGARASRIASQLHTSSRARSVSPTSHRFPAVATSTIKQPPSQVTETSTPPRLHATSLRHPVLSPRPVVSPGRTYIGESPGKIGNGTTRSDRVDLLERLVDVAPGDEEKTVDEVLKDLEAERKQTENEVAIEDGGNRTSLKPLVSFANVNLKRNPNLLNVFDQQLSPVKESNDNKTSSSPLTLDRINRLKPNTHNEGLDALERRLLQDVGTRKPETNRPTVFSLSFVENVSKGTSSGLLDKDISPLPSPSTVRLHPNPLRESQISELALNLDGHEDKDRVDDDVRIPSSPVAPEQKRSQEQEHFKKDNDVRNEAQGRVTEWLGGLHTISSPSTSADTVPTAVHLAEPKNAPPRKQSIDGVLGFFGIGRNRSKDDLRTTSPTVFSSKDSGHPDILTNANDKLAIPSQSIPSIPESSWQRRTPSPRRKPTLKSIESPPQTTEKVTESTEIVSGEDDSLNTTEDIITFVLTMFSTAKPVKDALPAAPGARKPVPKMGALDTKVPDPSETLSDPVLTHAIQTGETQPAAQVKETKAPTKPAKPDAVRGRPISTASNTPVIPPKKIARSLESSLTKPTRPTLSTPHEVKVERKVDIRNKDTLPPIPASTRINRLALPTPDSLAGANYDVRSARGGKGGIATSVAAIWASRAEENDKETKLLSVPNIPREKPVKRPQSLDPGKGKASSASTTSTSPNDKADPIQGEFRNLTKPETTSQNPIKSTSVPTKVDRYHAKPQLSSAATLARPALNPKYKPPSLSMTLGTISEPSVKNSTSSSSPAAKMSDERLFGPTRLKDLIKKYQQEAS